MSQNKNICDHIKLTKRTWNDEREKRQEGKLHRGRPQKLNTEQAQDHRETLELQGNRYYDATTIVQSLDISVARQAKQGGHNHKQSTVFKSTDKGTNNYIVPKADEILVDLHKILVFRDRDPFINAVCTKRRSKPKGTEKKFSREQRRVLVKNAYFRKTSMTVGELALDKGKAANSSKQGRVRNNLKNSEGNNKSCNDSERPETNNVGIVDKESQEPQREPK